MPGLRLLPLGIGNAFSAVSYLTCLALEADGCWLLIDCPHPMLKMMREAAATAGANLNAEATCAVVLTHLHADHSSGLEGLAYYNYFFLGRRLRLLAHERVAEHLWSGHLAAGMQWGKRERVGPEVERRFEDYFDLSTVPYETAVAVGPFTVSLYPAQHSVPTTAVFVEAAGRKFGYSADTSYDPALIEWLAGRPDCS